jgi:hypothetical protein
MPDPAVDTTCRALIEKYGDLGQGAADRLREWLSGTLPYTHPEILEEHCRKGQVELLFDAFWQLLPSGRAAAAGAWATAPTA